MSVIDDINRFTSEGDPCDLGWFGPVDEALRNKAIEIGGKKYCLVSEWEIWDLECSKDELKYIEGQGDKPVIIYAHNIIEDQRGRFPPGGFIRSSFLREFTAPGFFLTGNTMYVLIGKGVRKQMTLDFSASLSF